MQAIQFIGTFMQHPPKWALILAGVLYLLCIPEGIKNRRKYERWDKARKRQKKKA